MLFRINNTAGWASVIFDFERRQSNIKYKYHDTNWTIFVRSRCHQNCDAESHWSVLFRCLLHNYSRNVWFLLHDWFWILFERYRYMRACFWSKLRNHCRLRQDFGWHFARNTTLVVLLQVLFILSILHKVVYERRWGKLLWMHNEMHV